MYMATDDAPPRPGKYEPPSSPATDDSADYNDRVSEVHRPAVRNNLDELVSGEVRFEDYSRALYATGATACEVPPIGIVFPTSTADVPAIVGYYTKHSPAVLQRGGGTSLAGQTVNRGSCWISPDTWTTSSRSIRHSTGHASSRGQSSRI